MSLSMILNASWFSTLLFNNASFSDAVKVAALVVLLQNLAVPGFSWMRAENRALYFSLLSIANLLISLGANIVLVGMLHMGIVGSLMATGVGYALVIICTLPVILVRAGLSLRFDIARGLLSFGVPNIFAIVSVWVLQLSEKRKTWFNSIFTTLAALANLGFNLVLIPLYGAMGSALSTLLAYILLA